MNTYKKILKFLLSLSGCTSILLYLSLKTIKNTIGTLEINQLIWALRLNNKGLDKNILLLYLSYLAIAVFICFIYCVAIYKHKQILKLFFYSYIKKTSFYVSLSLKVKTLYPILGTLMLAIITNFGYHSFQRVNESADFIFFFKNNFAKSYPKVDFIKENYYVPKIDEVTFNQKKNVVIILVESFENTFFNKLNPHHLNTKIDLNGSLSFANFKQYSGTNLTIGALTAWHFGLPLILPLKDWNSYDKQYFLPYAISVFDILKYHGYKNYLLLGSDKDYSGQKNLFVQHGDFLIKDKNYWINNHFSLDEFKGTGWGFRDSFVLKKGIEQYKELLKANCSFTLVIETIDTHAPNGFAPKEFTKFNDLRDPIEYVDSEIALFVNEFKIINDPNTSLMILGDHNFMGKSKILDTTVQRTIFNAIYSNKNTWSVNKIQENVSALDIAPTILDLCGAQWSRKQFGLGFSLYSKEKSLAEKMGEQELNKNLNQKSKFYDRFF